ncbi:MAG: methyl-accepting chemotaxis protein [Nocardioidaceae bacterium]
MSFWRSAPEAAVDGVQVSVDEAKAMLGGNDELMLAAADLVEGIERVGESMVETTAAAEAAATATGQVEAGASAVASAATQISVAMREVSSSAAEATTVTSEAGTVTAQVRESVARLTDSTDQIGGVVRTVNDISDQTRMLALNATIEATRAGEAGRGFAVVAEEVKNLAAMTGQATTQIGEQLAALTHNADGVREAAERIDHVLGRIDELQQTIAAAVEEQTAAIAEITRAANEAAMAAQDLDISVSTSADAARAAAAAVERSRTWLTRVGTALDQQRRAMSSISETVEMHPLRKAITAHAGWKTNLRKAIDTGRVPEGIDRSKAARSDACAFGQWLRQGEGDAADPRFAPKVSDLHARFHREAAAILETAVSGNQDRARVMLTDEHGYLATAGELTDNLLTWLAQVERS